FTTASRKVCSRLERLHTIKRGAERPKAIDENSAMSESRLADCYHRFSSPGEQLELRDELERIEGALDRLTEEQREVVLLSYAMELPRLEIAERLGKPEGTVRSILHRALARLALELGVERDGSE
ncbi:MAG: sigma-70 family RNA polymerase sigma factor, partial [Planctomycetota bacterium]